MSLTNESATVAAGLLMGLAVVTACLRYYVRIFLLRGFWLDDWFSLLTLISAVAATSLYLDCMTRLALGRPSDDLEMIETTVRNVWATELLYITGSCLFKISFAITLLRLKRDRLFVYTLYAIMASVVVTSVVIFFVMFFECVPIHYIWLRVIDPYQLAVAAGKDPVAQGLKAGGHCASTRVQMNVTYSHTAVMLAADVLLGIVLPIVLLKDLKMRLGAKISAGMLLAIGALPGVASIAKLPFVTSLRRPNVLVDSYPLCVWWCLLEILAAVIATSLATIKPLAVRVGLIRGTAADYPQVSGSAYKSSKHGSTIKSRTAADSDVEMLPAKSEGWGANRENVVTTVEPDRKGGNDESRGSAVVLGGPDQTWGVIGKTVEVHKEYAEL